MSLDSADLSEALPRLAPQRAINALIARAETALSPVPTARERLETTGEIALSYAAASQAANTRRAYESDWRDFESWCAEAGLPCDLAVAGVDGRQVAFYLTTRAATLTVATLERRLAAIRAAHVAADLPRPEGRDLAAVWAGIRRRHGRPPARKTAIVVADLRLLLTGLPNTVAGLRDRAILLVGFGGALRRSELAALHLEPSSAPARLRLVAKGVEIRLDRSKGDQEGAGSVIVIQRGKRAETCASRALKAWLDAARITDGAIFRAVSEHGQIGRSAIAAKTVALVVKRACERAGYDPADFAGHSLRRGMATSAAEAGVAGHAIQAKLRHRKFDTTAGYIRDADRFANDASGKVDL